MNRSSWIVPFVLLGLACGSSQTETAEPEPVPAETTTEPVATETAEPAAEYPPEVRESFMNECVVEATEDACACVLAKMEATIPIEELSAGNVDEPTIQRYAVECLDELGYERRDGGDGDGE